MNAWRRRWLLGGLAAMVGGWVTRNALGAEEGEVVKTRMRRGNPPAQPLDTILLFERGDESSGAATTHEVLSLVHQEKGKKSYPWTMYASLETHHEEGDACVICSRLHKNGPGWSSGVHSEVFSHGRAVALGVNVEMSSDYAGEEDTVVIGLNVQATGGKRPMQYGIQVHDNESKANHFETAIGLNGRGKSGIDLGGAFAVGINARGNSIRVDEGTCIELDAAGKVRLRYRAGRIEFLNGEQCVGHIDVSGDDHAM